MAEEYEDSFRKKSCKSSKEEVKASQFTESEGDKNADMQGVKVLLSVLF